MFKQHSGFQLNKIAAIGLSAGIASSSLFFQEIIYPKKSFANPSFLEFRWDNSTNYKKLYYSQSSNERRDRSTYYLVIRPRDRNTAILKLKVTFPDYFDANIPLKKLTLCRVSVGGMLSKTRCLETIPATIEVASNQAYLEVFPNNPLPEDDTYALRMKIFNPAQAGMYQLNAFLQPPGDVPISRYVGSWSIDIE